MLNGKIEYGEVQFYFLENPYPENEEEQQNKIAYAVISVYGPPDQVMLEESFHTLHACSYMGQEGLVCVPHHAILTVISMQPLPPLPGDPENLWFVVEKGGLDDAQLDGYEVPGI